MNTANRQAQQQWNNNPCGADVVPPHINEDDVSYYDFIRNSRYYKSDKWMLKTIDFSIANNKKLLEIGYGIGSDLLTFCENGAECYGIDITEKHYQLAQKNFDLHDKKADLRLCNANNICFPDHFFDVVYSHGVLHHTDDVEHCVNEIYRVLKPGGIFILSVYHRYSFFHLGFILFIKGILQGKLFKLGYRGLMSTIEKGADGVKIKPYVTTYSKRRLRKLLNNFSNINFKIAHLDRDQLRWVGKLIPKTLFKYLEPRFGWYIIAFATKNI